MSTTVTVTPLSRRALWARQKTLYDTDEAEPAPPSKPPVAMSPAVQRVTEHIERGVEGLLDAIAEGDKLWKSGKCNTADRDALKAAAALVERRLGKARSAP